MSECESSACATCEMPEEFRKICIEVERITTVIDNAAPEEREKYKRIVELLMLAAVHTADTLSGARGAVDLFKSAAMAMIPPDRMMEALAPDVTETIRRIQQGGKDAEEIKHRAMLHAIPKNAPRH